MTTIRQIIIDAYRESGLVQVGLTPEAEELEEGLRKLQTLIRSLFGNELGYPLVSVSYGLQGLSNAYAKAEDVASELDSVYVPPGVRIVANLEAAKTLYLDPNPQDGDRVGVVDNAGNFATRNLILDGNGRKIEGAASVTLSINSTQKEWFYRADLGEWVLVDELTVNSQNPFPTEFDDFLITMLAIRMNPRYQEQTAPETVEQFRRMRRQFRARYSPKVETRSEEGLIRMPSRHCWQSGNPILVDLKFKRGFFY